MDFITLVQQCAPAVAHQTMAAIVKTESGFRPHAININGGARLVRQPASKEEAVVTAQWLLDNGYNIDMGLAQINSANLGRVRLTVAEVFDPCRNLAASATILQASFQAAKARTPGNDQAALHAALSAYNTGSFSRGFENGYVQRVVSNAPTAVPGQDQRITPIPLAVTGTPKPSAQQPQPQPLLAASPRGAVRLTADKPAPNMNADGPNVYAPSADSVMVY